LNWLSDKLVTHLRTVVGLPDLSGTKYRLLEKFSRGGMGTIYLAEDTQLQRKVALKVMHLADPTGEQAQRMWREARVIAQLEHPGIVPVHDVGELPDGRVFYVMKFVQGRRLDQYVDAESALPNRLRLFQKICEAVAFAHAHGVIHRDLKPENIMVGAFGEVLVMDWGVAKIVAESGGRRAEGRGQGAEGEGRGAKGEEREAKGEARKEKGEGRGVKGEGRKAKGEGCDTNNENGSISTTYETVHGTVIGTPAYMAPEQANGEIDQIDQRTDVYALGAILAFLLQGFPPDQSVSSTAKRKSFSVNTLFNQTAWKRKIPKPLAAIWAKAMASGKAGRYASALDLATDIEQFINGLSVSAYKENLLEKSWRWLKRYRFMVFLVLVYMVMRLILFFWLRP
jgi:serine/threonine protein kinase